MLLELSEQFEKQVECPYLERESHLDHAWFRGPGLQELWVLKECTSRGAHDVSSYGPIALTG